MLLPTTLRRVWLTSSPERPVNRVLDNAIDDLSGAFDCRKAVASCFGLRSAVFAHRAAHRLRPEPHFTTARPLHAGTTISKAIPIPSERYPFVGAATLLVG